MASLDWLIDLLAERRYPQLRFANDTPAPARWQVRNRCIDEGHLVLPKQGRVHYEVAGTAVQLSADRMVLVGPGIPHSGAPAESAWPHLLTARFAWSRPVRATGWAVLDLKDPGALVADLEELYRLYTLAGDTVHRATADALLLRLLCRTAAHSARPPRTSERLETVCQFLRRHPEARPSVDDLAARAGLSRRHFLKHFRRHTGTSPVQYQIRRRCEAAALALLETDTSIVQIAQTLGYSDAFTFSKQFKSVTGHAPQAYRRGKSS